MQWFLFLFLFHSIQANEDGYFYVKIEKVERILKFVFSFDKSDSLILSGAKLRKIEDDAFDNVRYLRELDLSHNNLTFNGQKCFNLPNLTYLSLAYNNLSSLCTDLSVYKRLEVLDLSNNPLDILDESDFVNLPENTQIILKDTGLLYFEHRSDVSLQAPIEMDPSCRNEKKFLIVAEMLRDMPRQIFPIQSTIVCIVNNVVISVEDTVDNNLPENCTLIGKGASYVGLHRKNISGFKNDWYHRLHNRSETLDLSYNNIKDISFVNNLPEQVKALNFSFNGIEKITKDAVKNRFIKYLYLHNNGIETIENGAFRDCKSLTFLNLGSNNISDIQFVSSLPSSLFELDLSINNISYLPKYIFSNLNNLYFLKLDSNFIEHIEPGVFFGLKEIHIQLAFNDITEVKNGSFDDLHCVTDLDLRVYGKWFQTVEEGFARNMKYLTHLQVGPVEKLENCVFSGLPFMSKVAVGNYTKSIRPKLFKGC